MTKAKTWLLTKEMHIQSERTYALNSTLASSENLLQRKIYFLSMTYSLKCEWKTLRNKMSSNRRIETKSSTTVSIMCLVRAASYKDKRECYSGPDYEVCKFLNFLATSIVAIRNKTPQTELASIFTMKTPIPLPIRNPIPTIPFAMNSHFMARSCFSAKTGATHNRAIPMKPYPSAANVQKKE
jgi:hypothetical protein